MRGATATTRAKAGPPRGILHRAAPDGTTEHERVLPAAELAPFVAHFWHVGWRLRSSFSAHTLPHPSVHVTFERSSGEERAWVGGVGTGRFTRRLEGTGWVFGIKFRPAAFAAVHDAPASTLTDRRLPLARLLGSEWGVLARAIFAAPDVAERIALAESFLTPRLRKLAVDVTRTRDAVERMEADRTLLSVKDAARATRCDVRTLQRAFRRYVGVPPKWVIQRYRLHEAAEQLRAPSPPSVAALAASLGYADQAHFSRDFKRVVGRTPRAFALPPRHATLRPG